MQRFAGKVALVTGGTRGIGFAIAERLGKEGAQVAICSRKQANVDKAKAQLVAAGVDEARVLAVACHVGSSEARAELVEQVVARFGAIDFLVSNVATNPTFGTMLETTSERVWDKIFDVNVKSHFFLVKQALPHLRRGGSVVFVSSYAGYKPSPMLGAYSVSKTALFGLTSVLSAELGERGIRVNCLAPGVIKTRFSQALWKSSEEVSNSFLSSIPLKRFGTPEDCAGAVAFMVSDDASYMTGEVVLVTGGIQARL